MRVLEDVPGVVFRDNRLCVNSQALCVEIEGWPEPRARQKAGWSVGWTDYRPAIDFKRGRFGSLGQAGQGLKASLESACKPFFRAVPDGVRQAVQAFPVGNPASVGQWDLFRLAGWAGEPAVDLMDSNPVLAFLIAARQDTLCENLRDLVRLPQNSLCAHLGFPDARWMGKLMRKMTCDDLRAPLLQALQRAIHDDVVVKLLQHVSSISVGVLRLVLDPVIRPHLTVPLLEEVVQKKYDQPALWMRQMLAQAEALNKPLDRLVFSSMATVWQLQDRLTLEQGKLRQHNLARQLTEGRAPQIIVQSRTRRKRTGSRTKKPHPQKQRTSPFDPPLESTSSIRPLTSALLIRHWAREQHNCLASRISWVQRGDYYIYQIVSPEEASLGIKWQKGQWKIHEIKGKYNRTVKPQTRTQVKTWLHTCQT